MITINKNTYNYVALTLTEKSLLSQPNYNLFVFTNETNDETKIFTTVDNSYYKDRYNFFTITESDTQSEDLLNGVIYISGNTAQWKYEVYESDTAFSSDTLSITATTGRILEKGRVLIKGSQANNTINQIYL